jgi:hypothetical protein
MKLDDANENESVIRRGEEILEVVEVGLGLTSCDNGRVTLVRRELAVWLYMICSLSFG